MSPVKIGILGLGTVGCGTLEVLNRNAEEIARRAGRSIVVTKAAVRSLNKSRPAVTNAIEISDDPNFVLDSPDIDIVVELIGGVHPADRFVTRALEQGRHVVTANKELLATKGNELFQIAQNSSVVIAFEAAVCGGISVIKAIREGLAGNRIESLTGIINGTSNYILTGMRDNGNTFEQALAEAQAQGYAEADPTFDIEGIDAVHKLIILASIAYGVPLQNIDDIFRKGIANVTIEDIAYADELGYFIKPVAVTRRVSLGVEMRVHPALVPKTNMLANVNGVMNAILLKADAVGKTLLYGPGAGAEPTASAVVADIVDVARVLTADPECRVPHLAFQPNALSNMTIIQKGEIQTTNYLRMNAINRAGVLADITKILGAHKISIESIIQKSDAPAHEQIVPIVILTQETAEANMDLAKQQLEALDTVKGDIMRIRIENGD